MLNTQVAVGDEAGDWEVIQISGGKPMRTLAEANAEILDGLAQSTEHMVRAATMYALVVTLGLWKQGHETRDEWERWLDRKRQERNIPQSTWATWVRCVCWLMERGLDPLELGQGYRLGDVYRLTKADQYRRGLALPADAVEKLPTPQADWLLREAAKEKELSWAAERPATEEIARLVREARQDPDGVEVWAQVEADDGFVSLFFRNADGEVHSVGVGILPNWVAQFLRVKLGLSVLAV